MDVWHRVRVRGCVLVQGTVVIIWMPIARGFLGEHVEGRGPGTGRGLDDAQLEHVVKFPLAALRHSGARHLGRAETGGPTVSM